MTAQVGSILSIKILIMIPAYAIGVSFFYLSIIILARGVSVIIRFVRMITKADGNKNMNNRSAITLAFFLNASLKKNSRATATAVARVIKVRRNVIPRLG